MTIEQLARETLAVLNQQAEFFRTKGRPELMKSKAMEKALRMKCEDLLNRQPKQAELIGSEPNA